MAGDDLDDQLDYSFDAVPDSPFASGDDFAQSDSADAVEASGESPKQEPTENPKPSKRSRKLNQKKKDEKQANMEARIDKKKQLGRREPAIIADYITSCVASKDLSAVEIQDKSVSESSIVDCSDWEGNRVLSRLPVFVKNLNLVDDNSLAIVLTISAIRACDACRALRSLKVPVGKLIPKNKPKQDQDLLNKKPKLVVATPGRVRRLVADQILDPGSVSKVIVEGSHIDSKANSVFDLPETVEVLNKLTKNGAKLYIF